MATSAALVDYATTCSESQKSTLFNQVKRHLMLAVLADIPNISQYHFDIADVLCNQLYERREDGEEEEILTYRTIVTRGQRELRAEVEQWRVEQGTFTF